MLSEAISTQLDEELAEVSNAADLLNTYLSSANALPDNFPTQALANLCDTLHFMRQGGTDTAVEVLSYARDVLPSLRKQFLQRSPPPSLDGKKDSEPEFSRGGYFDSHITRLFSAVGTALAHYQSENPNHEWDKITQEMPVSRNRQVDSGLRNIQQAAGRTEETILRGRDALLDKVDSTQIGADTIDRSIFDSATRLKALQVETGLTTPKTSRLERLGDALGSSASTLYKIARNIDKISPHIARAVGRLAEKEIESWASKLEIVVEAVEATVSEIRHITNTTRKSDTVETSVQDQTLPYESVSSLVIKFRNSRVAVEDASWVFKNARELVVSNFLRAGVPQPHVRCARNHSLGYLTDWEILFDGTSIWHGQLEAPIRSAFPSEYFSSVIQEIIPQVYSTEHSQVLVSSVQTHMPGIAEAALSKAGLELIHHSFTELLKRNGEIADPRAILQSIAKQSPN